MQEQNETNLSRAPVWRAFRAAAPQTLPVFAGDLVLGLGYGIYVQSLGLPVWLPPLMGATSRGIIIVNISQCSTGTVEMGRYESILKRNLSLNAYAQYYKDYNDNLHFDIMGGY